MANNMRWRYGDTNPVMAPVASGTVIEIGDLLYHEADQAKPASDLPDQGSEAINQSALHGAFLGVAMQASPAGSTDSIRVATTGVFEFPCDATLVSIGDFIGAPEDATGSALERQKAATVGTAGAAFGRSVKRVSPAGTSVLVDIVSSVCKGGVQAAS